MKNSLKWIILVFTTFYSCFLYGQFEDVKKIIGISISRSVISEKISESAVYSPTLISGNFYFNLFHNQKKLKLLTGISPIFGLVKVKGKTEVEFGIQPLTILQWNISNSFCLLGGIGSGPYIITSNLKTQAKGFIFTDKFSVGLIKAFPTQNNPILFKFEFYFRHMSNLWFEQPNLGIDNFMISLGLMKALK